MEDLMKTLSSNIIELNANLRKQTETLQELLTKVGLLQSPMVDTTTVSNPTGTQTLAVQLNEELNRRQLNDLTYKTKNSIKSWKSSLNRRNQAYAAAYRNTTVSDIYDEWLEREDMVVLVL